MDCHGGRRKLELQQVHIVSQTHRCSLSWGIGGGDIKFHSASLDTILRKRDTKARSHDQLQRRDLVGQA